MQDLISLEIVKEQYQRMSDEELIRFAKNESQKLTPTSFHLLKVELGSRNLDPAILESILVDRELKEATKLSEFEKTTAEEFTVTIWKFAFDEKEKAKSNEEIFNSLIKKNINPDYAWMLIESIEPKARELADSFGTEIIIGWILVLVGGLLVLFNLNYESSEARYLLWGGLLVILGLIRLITSYTKKSKYQTIVNNIVAEKERENNLFQ
jgi:hypothetical protein